MPFFVRQKGQISTKILPQMPNFASFWSAENEALSAMYNMLLRLTYSTKSCQNSWGFWLLLFSRKKTGDCWILGILNSCSFCLELHCELADH